MAGALVTAAVHRALLLVLAVVAVFIGGWAYFAAAGWYATFPGLGMNWLPRLGPYNQHLVKDVGSFYLGFAALSLAAAWRPRNTALVAAAGLAWVVFSVPHLVYHLQHLDMYDGVDRVLNVVSLSAFVVAGALLLVRPRPEPDR
ncbi:hypothetical protein L6E12_33750 [Actinokineospora sp. PR83]|uniref:hypothetical protein n=1 Tax=Actinokineospora sp. PR83 TaxID=2884908 RepID=UPI001F41E621|nr:hypothetical protein [Actinokineospora sp. PR83]MCG8920733.1 hypothetical protein [Actinokineospora sp. PR83]